MCRLVAEAYSSVDSDRKTAKDFRGEKHQRVNCVEIAAKNGRNVDGQGRENDSWKRLYL